MEPGSGRGKVNVTITWNNHKHSRSKNMLSLACTTYNRAKSLIHVRLSLSLCTLAVRKALCAFFDFWNDAAFDSDSDLLLLLLMKMILHHCFGTQINKSNYYYCCYYWYQIGISELKQPTYVYVLIHRLIALAAHYNCVCQLCCNCFTLYYYYYLRTHKQRNETPAVANGATQMRDDTHGQENYYWLKTLLTFLIRARF